MVGVSPVSTQKDDFRKASEIIMSHSDGPDFTLLDKKLLNYLLWYANQSARDRKDSKVHRIPMRQILDHFQESPERIKASLERLWRVKIKVDFVDENNVTHNVRCSYLSFEMTEIEGGWLVFAFDQILQRLLRHPKIYATIQLGKVSEFRSQYGLKLYEAMKMIVHSYNPEWRPTIEECKTYFEVGDQYDRLDNFKLRVIEPAIKEVNELAEFEVSVEYVKSGRGGKITGIVFRADLSGDRIASATDVTRRQQRRLRDKNTVDIFDGVTDLERFTPPTLRTDTMEEARRLLGPTGDSAVYRDRWLELRRGVGYGGNPDDMFLSWLRVEMAKKENEELADVDTEALLDSLLDEEGI